MKIRKCNNCNIEKELTQFFKWRTCCKVCINEQQKIDRLKSVEIYKKECADTSITRKCSKCNETKHISEFWRGNTKCKKCCHKIYYPQRNLIKSLLTRLRTRAKKRNLRFNLVPEDIIIPEFCPVLGIKIEMNIDYGKDSSPSVDKIKPELGYVKGNIQIISFRANMLKNNCKIKELELVIEYMKKNNCE
jgi:hypothetical protein